MVWHKKNLFMFVIMFVLFGGIALAAESGAESVPMTTRVFDVVVSTVLGLATFTTRWWWPLISQFLLSKIKNESYNTLATHVMAEVQNQAETKVKPEIQKAIADGVVDEAERKAIAKAIGESAYEAVKKSAEQLIETMPSFVQPMLRAMLPALIESVVAKAKAYKLIQGVSIPLPQSAPTVTVSYVDPQSAASSSDGSEVAQQ